MPEVKKYKALEAFEIPSKEEGNGGRFINANEEVSLTNDEAAPFLEKLEEVKDAE